MLKKKKSDGIRFLAVVSHECPCLAFSAEFALELRPLSLPFSPLTHCLYLFFPPFFLQPLCALLREKKALVCAGPSHLYMLLQIHTIRLQVQAT